MNITFVFFSIYHKGIFMNINDFEKIYCINLARRQDRKSRCEEIFRHFNLNVTFVDAVDGHSLKNIGRLKAGAAGCCMSHRKIYEDILNNSNINKALILEDDVEFDPELHHKFNKFYLEVPHDWNMLYLGGNHRNKPIAKVSKHVHRLKKTYTTHCYAVKRDALNMLLHRFSENVIFTMPADLHLAYLQKHMPCYGFSPHLAWQRADHSDIENQFKDYKHIR